MNTANAESFDALDLQKLEADITAPRNAATVREFGQFQKRARAHIAGAHVVRRLLRFFHGEIDLSAKQVDAGFRLLNKVLPDLKAVEVTATVRHEVALTRETLDAQLLAMGLNPADEWARLQNLKVINALAPIDLPVSDVQTVADSPET